MRLLPPGPKVQVRLYVNGEHVDTWDLTPKFLAPPEVESRLRAALDGLEKVNAVGK